MRSYAQAKRTTDNVTFRAGLGDDTGLEGESADVVICSQSFHNTGPVEILTVHKPAMRCEEYFRRFHKLKTERGVAMPPKGFKGMVLLGMLQAEYEREFIGVMPPQWLYKLLAGLGRLFGYQLPDQRAASSA